MRGVVAFDRARGAATRTAAVGFHSVGDAPPDELDHRVALRRDWLNQEETRWLRSRATLGRLKPSIYTASTTPRSGAADVTWLYDLSYFFGGAFLTNAVPHVVSGLTGRPFQSPFAKPQGQGLSSATTNVLWGFFNLAVGYVLIGHVGSFDPRSPADSIALGLGGLLIGLMLARWFGRFHDGNAPIDPHR